MTLLLPLIGTLVRDQKVQLRHYEMAVVVDNALEKGVEMNGTEFIDSCTHVTKVPKRLYSF